jgi:hypothetical protein
LRNKEPITTKQILRARIEYLKDGCPRRLDVLMGPFPYTGAVSEATGWFDEDGPRFHVQSSWALVSGPAPMIESNMAVGTVPGSTLVAQIDTTGVPTKHRIFLLHKAGRERATVRLKNNPDPSTFKVMVADQNDMYVEHEAGSDILKDSLPVPSDPNDPIRQFIEYVKARAQEAGVLEAGKIGG